MDGLDKLLAMPYGCGEQNMLKFAPNIYIMDYLMATNQATPAIENNAKEYMRSGKAAIYNHQLAHYTSYGFQDQNCSNFLVISIIS